MSARGGVLVILSGALPTAAAATNTERGRAMFSRTVTWLLAFVLYKPVAAFIYAAAFRLAGSSPLSADGLVSVITGLGLIMLSIFALPALMRVLTPAVSAVSSSGGGGGAADRGDVHPRHRRRLRRRGVGGADRCGDARRGHRRRRRGRDIGYRGGRRCGWHGCCRCCGRAVGRRRYGRVRRRETHRRPRHRPHILTPRRPPL
jgi:hypothetical protein